MNVFLLLIFLITLAYFVIISAFSIGWFLIKYYYTSGKIPVTKVSIIVPARNEELNIVNCLNDLIIEEVFAFFAISGPFFLTRPKPIFSKNFNL